MKNPNPDLAPMWCNTKNRKKIQKRSRLPPNHNYNFDLQDAAIQGPSFFCTAPLLTVTTFPPVPPLISLTIDSSYRRSISH